MVEIDYNRDSKYKNDSKEKKKKVMDPFLGEITLNFNDSFQPVYYSKIKNINSDIAFWKEINILKKHLEITNEYFVNLLDYSSKKETGFCHINYHIETYYEYFTQNLLKDIKERKVNSDKYYTSEELTNLLYQMVIVNSFLQNNQIIHGDINPGLIFINNNKNFKLNNKQFNWSPEECLINKITKNQDIYSSPELLAKTKNRNIKIDYVKSDVFSLGLCILEAGLLRDINDIYLNKFKLNEGFLAKYIKEFEEKYNDNHLLYTTLAKMLEISPSDRVDFDEIINTLPDYNQILQYFEDLNNGEYNEEENINYKSLNSSTLEKSNEQYFKFDNIDSKDENIHQNSNKEFYNNITDNVNLIKSENNYHKKNSENLNKKEEYIPPKPMIPPKITSKNKPPIPPNPKNFKKPINVKANINIDNNKNQPIKKDIPIIKENTKISEKIITEPDNKQVNTPKTDIIKPKIPSLDNNIIIEYFNGIPHKEIKEETFEIKENGKKIRKIVIRYVPIKISNN